MNLIQLQNLIMNATVKSAQFGAVQLPEQIKTAIDNVVTIGVALSASWLVLIIMGCGFTAWYYEDGIRRIKEKAIAIGVGSLCIFGATTIALTVQNMFTL